MQFAVNILALASIYALIACGYVLIYRVSRVLNLAHGELMMLGAYLLVTTASGFTANPLLAVALAAVLSLVVGGLVYLFLMSRMTGEMVLAAVLATVALGICIRGVVILIWSAQLYHPRTLLEWENPVISLPGDASISLYAGLLIVATVIAYGALFLFLRFSRWGMRMRAAGQNPLLASQRGINLHGIFALAWGLSTFTGATAGMLMALNSNLDTTMAVIGLKAFPAALVGGLDSLAGALVGALIIAAAEVGVVQFIDPLLAEVIPFAVMLVMLIIRPWGLFGTREKLDRV